MSQLQLTNVINVSVSSAPTGAGSYNTSNVALFTRETPGGSFGSDPFKIYLTAADVTDDWGTGSVTSDMSNALFSQSPNILAGGGYLVVIPFLTSETLAAAITRTKDLVQYFGIMAAEMVTVTPGLAAAAVIQTLNKIGFVVSRTAGDVAPGAYLDELRTGSFDQTRGLFYGGVTDLSALQMLAAYVGRALTTNFSGSKTTQTMHLKDLKTIQPDPSMTQTLLLACGAAGADVYVSLQGVSKTFCSGKNKFFDQVYNEQWFAGALQVAGFNALAESSTKLPQTEDGMTVLKSAYRQVCEQAVTNQYAAPGTWTGVDTFGNQQDFLRNISERGYYIFTAPIANQSPVDRAARKAPLAQIAIKEAGAAHSSNVLVFINA